MKKFLCVWPEGYGDAKPMEVDLEFFSWRRGYDPEQIMIVESLKVNEKADFSCVTGVHYVIRKD